MSGVEAVAWSVPTELPPEFPWRKRESERVTKLTKDAQPEHGFTAALYSQATVDTLRAQLEAAEADAARAQSRQEHTQQWYAERMAKIEEIAKREGLWDEVAAVFANGSATRRLPDGSYFYDPPTYAQQLNMAKHKAATSEARAEAAEADALRWRTWRALDEHAAADIAWTGGDADGRDAAIDARTKEKQA